MQKHSPLDYCEVTPSAAITPAAHGWRAKCLQRLVRLDLPVPMTVALPTQTVRAIAAGHTLDTRAILAHFGDAPLISVRPSPENPDWGGPGTVLNVGMNDARHAEIVPLSPGTCVSIPAGTGFQFRAAPGEPLVAVAMTVPPLVEVERDQPCWPSKGRSVVTLGVELRAPLV